MSYTNKGYRLRTKISTFRRIVSYIAIWIISAIPMAISFLVPIHPFTVTLLEFPVFDMTISILFSTEIIPLTLSVAMGSTLSFIAWCYYTRTQCLEEQVPGSTLLHSN